MAGIVEIDPSKIMKGVGSLAVKLRTAITGIDPEQRGKLETIITEIEGKVNLGQIAINQEEAKHPSLFVSGWRPFIGWVCGFALVYHFILNRLVEWALKIWYPTVIAPTFEVKDLIAILLGLLGLGGFRTIEKVTGVARNRWKGKK